MLTELQRLRERKSKWKARLVETLGSVKQQLIGIGALKIILFGSLATGKLHSGSDIDLIVILPDTKSSKEWRKIIYEGVERDTGCDFFVYNKTTFETKKEVSILLKTALKEGKAIYER